jgi:hypothetical protein
MPQLPQTFSEPFCCHICRLLHNKEGKGPDAFDVTDGIVRAIEIKATITNNGFTDIKRDMNFNELYWVSMKSPEYFSFEIYRIERSRLEHYVESSKTERDRGTISLDKITKQEGIRPAFKGRIGIQLRQ